MVWKGNGKSFINYGWEVWQNQGSQRIPVWTQFWHKTHWWQYYENKPTILYIWEHCRGSDHLGNLNSPSNNVFFEDACYYIIIDLEPFVTGSRLEMLVETTGALQWMIGINLPASGSIVGAFPIFQVVYYSTYWVHTTYIPDFRGLSGLWWRFFRRQAKH